MNGEPIRCAHLPASGVRLHVAQAGQGSPVLMLHGFPDHWELWRPLMVELSCEHKVLAPDLRGINLSDKPTAVSDYDIARLVDDVRALIEHLGGRCALVGHDWGGLLAWTVAAQLPDAVSRLVVFNAPHPCRFAEELQASPRQREASAYAQRLCQAGAADRLAQDSFERLWAVRSDGRTGAEWTARRPACAQAWSQPGALQAALNWYRALNLEAALAPAGVRSVPDLGQASGVIDVPTLVVWGERDGSFPVACLEGLERWVPDLSVHREPEGGHWLLEEQHALAASLLRDFLALQA